ncbi:MAG TPA: NUDIX hydrolase [Ktedonobacterales bacterium]|nr:NUDIX hydrolase [Ktedonobacterales bacterium]
MLDWLPDAMRTEVETLATQYGRPLLRAQDISAQSFVQDVARHRRFEVCMVIRRPSGRLLVFTKTFYPDGVFRLLTGGVEPGETIRDALLREVHEETGLRVTIARFLAALIRTAHGTPLFATFAFLLDEIGGALGALDPTERVVAFREVARDELLTLAETLDTLTGYSTDLETRWDEWGAFRAATHRVIWEALRGGESE